MKGVVKSTEKQLSRCHRGIIDSLLSCVLPDDCSDTRYSKRKDDNANAALPLELAGQENL